MMIDLDKLKLAHDLAINSKNYYIQIYLGIGSVPDYFIGYTDDSEDNKKLIVCRSLDDLISTLQELMQPKLKYAIGQEVWFVILAKEWHPINLCIEAIENDKYLVAGNWMTENKLYPSRESLIQAQIDYWQSLLPQGSIETGQEGSPGTMEAYPASKPPFRMIIPTTYVCEKVRNLFPGEYECPCESREECQHENDGMIYTSIPPQNKCKKCGEFYR